MEKIGATGEEMRDSKVPWLGTVQELTEYINSVTDRPHDYGTCVYAMSMAATAAFQYVAGKLGVMGFQASCADIDILRRTRSIKGPFAFINAEDMLYPQYNIIEKVKGYLKEWNEWAAIEAQKKLDEFHGMNNVKTIKNDDGTTFEMHDVHPNVWEHWKSLASLLR